MPTPTRKQLQEEIDRLMNERDDACVAHEASEATLAMTVARLGGTVEGAPTRRINFLQRVDQLRAFEEVADEFVAYYTQRGGCSNCGGIPHSTTCFVGRFERLRPDPPREA